MKRIKTWVAAHSVLTTIVLMLAITGSAFAAWIVFSGVSGSGGAKVGTAQVSPALSLTPQYDGTQVIPGQDGTVKADIKNNDTVAHTLTALTFGTITATPPCDTSGLSVSASNALPISVPAGGTVFDFPVASIHAAANLDPNCANAQIDVQFTGGTTSP